MVIFSGFSLATTVLKLVVFTECIKTNTCLSYDILIIGQADGCVCTYRNNSTNFIINLYNFFLTSNKRFKKQRIL